MKEPIIKNVVNLCTQYCLGCGLCSSEKHLKMEKDKKGYLKAVISDEDRAFLTDICPVTKTYVGTSYEETIWGRIEEKYAAWSADESVRNMSSSGGVLTALCLFLLDTKKVDGIIQVCSDESDPTATKCIVSRTKEQVLSCSGSRYAISSPWTDLSNIVLSEENYAAVGKPCDIAALQRLIEKEKRYGNIKYLLSFFCAGMPSKNANEKLLRTLGCSKELIAGLRYRGNGWPGYATATDRSGKEYKMEYSKAWGQILGRDVHTFCRICLDGIGLEADISCGDGWYIKDSEPDFSEKDGRNIVFIRNDVGKALFDQAVDAGYLAAEKWNNIDDLKIIQYYQYSRKATMRAKIKAFKLFGRPVPPYDKKVLSMLAGQIPLKERFKVFYGTVKRIIKKKI